MEKLDIALEDSEGKISQKVVYVVLFESGASIKKKLERVCDSFGKERFELGGMEIGERVEDIERQITETKLLLEGTETEIKDILNYFSSGGKSQLFGDIGEMSLLCFLKFYIQREKAIYYTLNLMKAEGTFFRGLAWIPRHEERRVQDTLKEIGRDKNFIPPTIKRVVTQVLKPPSYFKLNEFTKPFQAIVDTYGIPSYREVNPGIFTIVSFPFLFGLMFGDCCHGLILLIFSN